MPEHYLGAMDQICQFCGSLNFIDERTSGDTDLFTMCCQKGKVSLPPLGPTHPLLYDLLTSKTPRADNFRNLIIDYNASLAFASR